MHSTAEDIGNRAPVMPDYDAKIEAAAAPKPTAGGILTKGAIPEDLTPGSNAPDAGDLIEVGRSAKEAQDWRNKQSFWDRLDAAIDKNWISSMIIRGLQREDYESDPVWFKQYIKRAEEYESLAQDQDELDDLRRSATSEAGYYDWAKRTEAKRYQNRVINSTDNGWAYNFAAFVFDPAKFLILAIIIFAFRRRSNLRKS